MVIKGISMRPRSPTILETHLNARMPTVRIAGCLAVARILAAETIIAQTPRTVAHGSSSLASLQAEIIT